MYTFPDLALLMGLLETEFVVECVGTDSINIGKLSYS